LCRRRAMHQHVPVTGSGPRLGHGADDPIRHIGH
jgi:hypothetical protein